MTIEETGGVQKHFKAEHDLWRIKLWQHGPVFCKMNVIVLVQAHKTATFPQTNVFCVNKTDGRPSKGSPKADRAVRSNHGKLVGGWNRFGNKAPSYNVSGYEIQSGNVSAHEDHLYPDLCLNLKSESVAVTPKSTNCVVLTEMRIRSWCQHFRNNKYFNKRRHTAEKNHICNKAG